VSERDGQYPQARHATFRRAAKRARSRVLIRPRMARTIARILIARRTDVWILLLLPFIGLLWVPFYNFAEPSLFGFPFFYWYQFAWVVLTSALLYIVYRRLKSH
jgi:hypothetical protein